MVTSTSCLIIFKRGCQWWWWGGGDAGSWLRLPLCGAVYNSLMWDSQKGTPNRTSCGCKIPRCQELKITALEPQPPRDGGEGACSLRGQRQPEPCISSPLISGCPAAMPAIAISQTSIWVGTHPKLPLCQLILCPQRIFAVCLGASCKKL